MGKRLVKWKSGAVKNLEAIFRYIAIEKQSPETAIRYTNSLIDFCEELADAGPSIRNSRYGGFEDYKSISFKRTYVVFFKVNEKHINIYRIIHGKALKS